MNIINLLSAEPAAKRVVKVKVIAIITTVSTDKHSTEKILK